MELVEAHVADLQIPQRDEILFIQQAVILAAEHLHESGHTAAWDRLKPAGFFDRLAFMSQEDQASIAQRLLGFYVWLACRRLIPAEAALDIVRRLAGLFPSAEDMQILLQVSAPLLTTIAKKALLN
jgi:hypothetical protein